MNASPFGFLLCSVLLLFGNMTMTVCEGKQADRMKHSRGLQDWRREVKIRLVNLADFKTQSPASVDVVFWKSRGDKDPLDAAIDFVTTADHARSLRDETSKHEFVILLLSGMLKMLDDVTLAGVRTRGDTLLIRFRIRLLQPGDSPGFEPGLAVAFILVPIRSLPDNIAVLDVRLACNGGRALPNAGLPTRLTIPLRHKKERVGSGGGEVRGKSPG
jgi:hypothetical protein